ncbi:metal-dependent transcriptional regulator [Anaerolentibacter hominis]|uniref:metal-dependent transcriptional regulator n=1 Tax=Anaerolentibacter hominis TaxID=3079009 RepID=UPI0031B861DE
MLSASKKRYLFSIGKLSLNGQKISCKEIADDLCVKPPSVSKMLTLLAGEDLIEKAHYGKITLTEKGLRPANQLYTNFLILSSFFHNLLLLPEEQAVKDAATCVCELSEECIAGLVSLAMRHPEVPGRRTGQTEEAETTPENLIYKI